MFIGSHWSGHEEGKARVMTYNAVLEYLIPALILASIVGGIRISMKLDSLSKTVEIGMINLHNDIGDLKMGRSDHEARIHDLEVEQARRIGREEGLKQATGDRK